MERVKKQTKRLSKSVHPRNIPSARMGLSPTTPIDATTRECCFPDCAGPSTAMAVPLPNSTSHVTMAPATPDDLARIGRKSMSRRSGQSGSIQKEGNWYVVRYWKDVAGQEKRKRVYERICPISGPGKLSASERERKAKEIIAASGVDTQEYFDKVVTQSSNGVTFREQADKWLEAMRNRRRKQPLAPSTIATWAYALEKWINPNLGDLPLESINNASLKKLVDTMVEGGLSPKSVSNYSQVVKIVMKSVRDEKGQRVFNVEWDHEYIEMPVVNPQKQRRPSFTGDVVTAIVENTDEQKYRVLFALLASSGLRFGEALGLNINNISPDCSTIKIVQKAWGSEVQDRLKTVRGEREVDLHPDMAGMLREFIGDRNSGLLFVSRRGRPLQPVERPAAQAAPNPGQARPAKVRRPCVPSLSQHVPAELHGHPSRRLAVLDGPERVCPTSTTRSNRTWGFAKKWQRKPVWVSSFRPKSSLLDGNSNLRAIWK